MSNSYFSINSAGGERMTPEQYGYWIVRWSHDGASGTLEDLKAKQFDLSPFVMVFRKSSFWAHMQFMAIYHASYWFYATEFMRVPIEVQERMLIGRTDCIKELRTGSGDRYDSFQEQYFRGSCSAYLKANIEDFVSSQVDDPRVYKPDASAVAKKFFEITCPLYPDTKSISAADQMLIGHFVSDIPIGLYKALKEDIKMSYVA